MLKREHVRERKFASLDDETLAEILKGRRDHELSPYFKQDDQGRRRIEVPEARPLQVIEEKRHQTKVIAQIHHELGHMAAKPIKCHMSQNFWFPRTTQEL